MFDENFKFNPKKFVNEINQISKNIESIFLKNEPYSIYLTAEYNGINIFVLTNPWNINKIIAILINKNIQDKIIDFTAIFFNSEGFFKIGGIKNI